MPEDNKPKVTLIKQSRNIEQSAPAQAKVEVTPEKKKIVIIKKKPAVVVKAQPVEAATAEPKKAPEVVEAPAVQAAPAVEAVAPVSHGEYAGFPGGSE